MRTRPGWTISYKSLYFGPPLSLELVFRGIRERSIVVRSQSIVVTSDQAVYKRYFTILLYLPGNLLSAFCLLRCRYKTMNGSST